MCECFKKEKICGILASILLVVVIIYIASLFRNSLKSYQYIGQSATERDVITISGEGKVTVTPDIATITLGTSIEKKTVSDAQKENTEKINNLIKELKALDIAKEDIKTQSYNIYPQYDYNDGRSFIKGYSVAQNVLVKIRDLEKVSDVIAKAGELELNQVSGLSFTIDDIEKVRQEAREKALENAKDKADSLAKKAGVSLGKIVSFSESSGYDYPQPMYYAEKAIGIGGGGAAPSIEAGSQEVSITATISWEILN